MTVPITVIVPVGPLPHQSVNIIPCLESVNVQMEKPDELIIIDDSGILEPGIMDCPCTNTIPSALVFRSPEGTKGIAAAFNYGLSLAKNELIFFLGSDDLLKPECIGRCWKAWEYFGHALGWYFVGVEYSNGNTQNTPCLAAMVSKELWRVAGPLKNDGEHNYPGCEVEYISRMIFAGGEFGSTYRVSDDVLYWVRMRAGMSGWTGQ